VHALQLEVSRALYMDERTLTLFCASDSAAPTRLLARSAESVGDTDACAPVDLDLARSERAGPGMRPKSAKWAPPPARLARDFAELRRRVSCLIARLAWESEASCRSGTSTLHARATEGDRAWEPFRDT
jgi:hypothetical protein